jgi:predicted transposase YdaD
MNEFHPNNPHDHFVRRTFDVADHTRALLKANLPPELLAGIRLDTLQPAKETFLSADEHEKRLDLLYSASFVDGTEVLIYLLLEHKSEIDRHIALQLLSYVLKIQAWRRRNKKPPCVVIPMVIYHGDKPWDEPTSLRDKIRAGDRLSPFVPDMQAFIVDLSRQSAELLPDAPDLAARIRTIQLVRSAELEFDSIVGIFRLLQAWQKIDSHRDALTDIILYLCAVFDAGKLDWFKQAIHTGLQIDSETSMPTCYEALVEQGMKKGLEKGREQGLLIGRIRTLQEVLGQTVAAENVLVSLPLEDLQTLAAQLQEFLATRPLHPGNG